MNKVLLMGRITKEVELKQSANGGVARFTVAVNRIKKGEADFINCVAFGKTAEMMSQYFGKGKPIIIEGHLQTGSYDAQDGTKRYTTDIVVERIEFVLGDKTANTGADVHNQGMPQGDFQNTPNMNQGMPQGNFQSMPNMNQGMPQGNLQGMNMGQFAPISNGDMPF